MCPNWGLNLQPSHVPWPGMEPTTFWDMGRCFNQLSHPVRASLGILRTSLLTWMLRLVLWGRCHSGIWIYKFRIYSSNTCNLNIQTREDESNQMITMVKNQSSLLLLWQMVFLSPEVSLFKTIIYILWQLGMKSYIWVWVPFSYSWMLGKRKKRGWVQKLNWDS